MKSKEETLLWRNKIAATLGSNETQAVLKQFLETERQYMNSMRVNANDPNGYNLHRELGRVEMLDYLIAQGKQATEPKEGKHA